MLNIEKQQLEAEYLHPYFESPLTIEERKKLIGQRLQAVRKHHRMSQRDISAYIGVTAQTYGGYELGKYEPSAETLIRIAFIYDVTLEYLTGMHDHKTGFATGGANTDEEEQAAAFDPEKKRDLSMRIAMLEHELSEIKKHYTDDMD